MKSVLLRALFRAEERTLLTSPFYKACHFELPRLHITVVESFFFCQCAFSRRNYTELALKGLSKVGDLIQNFLTSFEVSISRTPQQPVLGFCAHLLCRWLSTLHARSRTLNTLRNVGSLERSHNAMSSGRKNEGADAWRCQYLASS